VLGRFHVKTIRDEFKRVGDATGALRDEEVLVETIEALDLGEKDRNLLGPWMARRAEQEQILRQSAIRMLESGCLDAPIEHLQALLLLPLPPKRDKEAHRFARKAVLKAQRQVEVLCTEDVGDVSGMHNLRIAFKRLRYAVEALGPALPLELRVWEQVGARFQKILGNLHDQDVAMDTLRASKDLSNELRDAVLDALKRKREVYAQQYLARAKTMIGCELPPGEGLEKDSQS
jgi:CHAD domain-containing protein